jgi:hypothetical protein
VLRWFLTELENKTDRDWGKTEKNIYPRNLLKAALGGENSVARLVSAEKVDTVDLNSTASSRRSEVVRAKQECRHLLWWSEACRTELPPSRILKWLSPRRRRDKACISKRSMLASTEARSSLCYSIQFKDLPDLYPGSMPMPMYSYYMGTQSRTFKQDPR